jgi:hypothetical protein
MVYGISNLVVEAGRSYSPVNAKASIVSTIPSESDSTATFSALSEVDVPVQHVAFLSPYGAWGASGITYRTTDTINTLFIYECTDFVTSDPPEYYPQHLIAYNYSTGLWVDGGDGSPDAPVHNSDGTVSYSDGTTFYFKIDNPYAVLA